jgi:hypothetical protein
MDPASEWHLRALRQDVARRIRGVVPKKEIYGSIAELQADLDAWLKTQRVAPASAATVLWQNADANLR